MCPSQIISALLSALIHGATPVKQHLEISLNSTLEIQYSMSVFYSLLRTLLLKTRDLNWQTCSNFFLDPALAGLHRRGRWQMHWRTRWTSDCSSQRSSQDFWKREHTECILWPKTDIFMTAHAGVLFICILSEGSSLMTHFLFLPEHGSLLNTEPQNGVGRYLSRLRNCRLIQREPPRWSSPAKSVTTPCAQVTDLYGF